MSKAFDKSNAQMLTVKPFLLLNYVDAVLNWKKKEVAVLSIEAPKPPRIEVPKASREEWYGEGARQGVNFC